MYQPAFAVVISLKCRPHIGVVFSLVWVSKPIHWSGNSPPNQPNYLFDTHPFRLKSESFGKPKYVFRLALPEMGFGNLHLARLVRWGYGWNRSNAGAYRSMSFNS